MKLSAYRLIAPAVNADVKTALAKHGLSVTQTRAIIDEMTGEIRMNLTLCEANGETPEAKRWKEFASLHSLNPAWLGQSFVANGQKYTVTGLRSTRTSKKNVCVTRADGKHFTATPDLIRRNLTPRA